MDEEKLNQLHKQIADCFLTGLKDPDAKVRHILTDAYNVGFSEGKSKISKDNFYITCFLLAFYSKLRGNQAITTKFLENVDYDEFMKQFDSILLVKRSV